MHIPARCLAALVILGLAACTPATTQPGQPSSSDVNPATGSRGGSGAAH